MEIKEIIKLLGKVSITTNGEWNKCRRYDRLCLVYNDYQSYLSKKRVPAGIELDNETYWQPVAALKDVIKEDYKVFKLDILNALEVVNNKLKSSRLVVETFNDFLELRYDDVRVGAKVYVIEEDIEYIIDSIDRFGTAKTYHDLKDSIISEISNTDVGRMPNVVADRAIADEDGNNIKDNYVTKEYLDSYFFGNGATLNKQQIESLIDEKLKNYSNTDEIKKVISSILNDFEYNIKNHIAAEFESRISALEGYYKQLENKFGTLNAKIIKYHGTE